MIPKSDTPADANPCGEIDLSGIDQSAPGAPDRQAGTMTGPVMDALDAIGGLRLRHLSYRHDDIGRLSGVITFTGWSPSLHSVNIEMPIYADTGGQDEVLFHIGHRLDRQRARAAHAKSLGIHAPLWGAGYNIIEHLWTDRSLVAMRETAPGLQPLKTRLASILQQVHMMGGNHDAGPVHAMASGVVAEMVFRAARPDAGHDVTAGIGLPARCDVKRFGGAAMEIDPDGGLKERRTLQSSNPTYDGLLLTIPSGPLPEITLAALKGRPLRDLTEIHPELDGRIIDQARNASDGKRITVALVPDLVRVGDTD